MCTEIIKNFLERNYQLIYTDLEEEECILLSRKINNSEVTKTNIGSTIAKCKCITTADEGSSPLGKKVNIHRK